METLAIGEVVGPGDILGALPDTGTVRAGPGLSAQNGKLTTSKAGVLRKTKAGKLWVEGRQRRYVPAVDDLVVGTIMDKIIDSHWVDIGAPRFLPYLPILAFGEPHAKTGRTSVRGDLVYARIKSAPRDCGNRSSFAWISQDGFAVGQNGRVWVKAKDARSTVKVVNCLQRADSCLLYSRKPLVKKVLASAP
eukprot:jgi/Botrbrau1/12239/Bobra.0361s0005.3